LCRGRRESTKSWDDQKIAQEGDEEDRRLSEGNVECQEERGYTINTTEKRPLAVKRSVVASVKVAPVDYRKVLSDVKDMEVVDVNCPSEQFGRKERKTLKNPGALC